MISRTLMNRTQVKSKRLKSTLIRCCLMIAAAVAFGTNVCPAVADINVLAIGDSLTRGNRRDSAPPLATYRPYLWQTARNYLDTVPGGTHGVDINFIGTEGNSSVTPIYPIQSAIPIDNDWDMNHQGFGGATSQSFTTLGRTTRPNSRFMGNVLDRLNKAGTVPDVATILLGTNDLAVIGNQGSATGFVFNRMDPLDAVDSIEFIATVLRDGYNSNNDPEYQGQFGSQLIVEGNPDIKVLIAAVPPIDETRRFNGGGTQDLAADAPNEFPGTTPHSWIWTENDRENIVDTNFRSTGLFDQDLITNTGGGGQFGAPFERASGSADTSQSTETDANDVIGVMNDLIFDLTMDELKDPHDNWIFVNPFESTHLLDANGNEVAVDNGQTFDLGGTGRAIWDPTINGGAGGFVTSPNHDLADGLHLSFSGDQYYAGNFWDADGGIRSILDDAIADANRARGDFDDDGLLGATDIDLLSAAVGEEADLRFDLTADGVVDQADRDYWVRELSGTEFGDATLDQSIAFMDFLALANGFGESGGWANGDFDGNGEVSFLDFLALAENFGTTNALSTSTVPEPNALPVMLCAFLAFVLRYRFQDRSPR